MKKSLLATLLLAAMMFPAGPALIVEFAALMESETVASQCADRSSPLCDPPRIEDPLSGAARPADSKADIEPEKWALLLLEFCAAGCVLVRSERARTGRGARFHLLSSGHGSPFAETAIGFRTF